MKGLLKKIGITFLIIIVVLIAGRNVIAHIGAKVGLKAMTGLTLKMDKIRIGLFSTDFDIQGLKIYNPKGFQDKVMLDLPRFYVNYDLSDILAKKIHLNDFKFDLKEFMLVSNSDGTTNIDGFKKLAAGKKAKQEKAVKKDSGKKEPMSFQFDLVELKVGKIITKDYSGSGKPRVDEYNIGMDERFENVTDPKAFVSRITMKYMGKFMTSAIRNFGVGDLTDALGGSVKAIGDLGTGATKSVTTLGKDAVKDASGLLKNTGDGLKNIMKLPFGGEK